MGGPKPHWPDSLTAGSAGNYRSHAKSVHAECSGKGSGSRQSRAGKPRQSGPSYVFGGLDHQEANGIHFFDPVLLRTLD